VSRFFTGVFRHPLLIFFGLAPFIAWIFNRKAPAAQSATGGRLALSCSVLWIALVFFGVTIVGRFYPHYLIQFVSPLILLYCSSLVRMPSFLRKIMVAMIVVFCLIANSQFFLRQQEYRPQVLKRVERSEAIAQYIRKNSKESDGLFLYEEHSLDIFYLARRLSPNGIYMYIDMDSAHTNDLEAERKLRLKLQTSLPRVIVWGPGVPQEFPTSRSTAPIFFSELVQKHYRLQKEIRKAKLYFLK